jgi:hypothetical protein
VTDHVDLLNIRLRKDGVDLAMHSKCRGPNISQIDHSEIEGKHAEAIFFESLLEGIHRATRSHETVDENDGPNACFQVIKGGETLAPISSSQVHQVLYAVGPAGEILLDAAAFAQPSARSASQPPT